MIRRMTLVFLGALWASTAQAQDCGQCWPQRVQCEQQAYNEQQSCLAPYILTLQHCVAEAEAYRSWCWQTCTHYCNYCDYQADGMIQQCEIQYDGEWDYCQTGYNASWYICAENYDTCTASCSYGLSAAGIRGGASLWNAPPTASATCVDVSVSRRAPTL